jgi:hypothetical protein
MLTLEVSPGNYTGQFQLGMPISEIVKFLKKFDSVTGHINKIDILYSQTVGFRYFSELIKNRIL